MQHTYVTHWERLLPWGPLPRDLSLSPFLFQFITVFLLLLAVSLGIPRLFGWLGSTFVRIQPPNRNNIPCSFSMKCYCITFVDYVADHIFHKNNVEVSKNFINLSYELMIWLNCIRMCDLLTVSKVRNRK